MNILMVCLGNICRSPLAEGIMQSLIDKYNLDWSVDSAGTASYHIGELPDSRSIEIAQKFGIDITNQRSRPIVESDFYAYDLILVMDAENYQNINKIKPNDSECKIELILNYAYPNENRQVPDPYYGGGFEKVFRMLEIACKKLVDQAID